MPRARPCLEDRAATSSGAAAEEAPGRVSRRRSSSLRRATALLAPQTRT